MVLVLIMCIAALGVRPAIMIGMSIPISFMNAVPVINFMGMSINMKTMFGMVIAVGVLVDDPSVVAVADITAATLGAFVPPLFWPGIIGKFMSYLPIVVMVAALISALIFMPVIGALVAKQEHDPKAQAAAEIGMFPDKSDPKKVRGVIGVYVRIMARLMNRPLLTLGAGFAIVGFTFFYYIQNHPAMEAFPASEPENGTVSVIPRGNHSPIEVRDMLLEVQDQVIRVVGIQDVIMAFGGGQNSPPDTIGTLQLQLRPSSERLPAPQIFAEIRERVKGISGLEVQIAAEENGPPAGKAINLRVELRFWPICRPRSPSCVGLSKANRVVRLTSKMAVPRRVSNGNWPLTGSRRRNMACRSAIWGLMFNWSPTACASDPTAPRTPRTSWTSACACPSISAA